MYLFKNKKRSRYWQIGFMRNGRMTSISTKTVNRRKAERILEERKNKFPEDSTENTISLKDYIDEYVNTLSMYRSESYVQRSIKPAFKELYNYTGNVSINELDARLLEQFILSVYKRSKYSGHLYLKTLKAAFNKAIEWEYCKGNPLFKIKLPAIQRKEPLFISFEELTKIVNATDSQILKDIFVFAFFTGLRLSEILQLTSEDINLNESIIRVGSESFTTKSRRLRFVPIAKNVLEIFDRIKPEKFNKGKYYLFNHHGSPYHRDYITHKFKECVLAAGLNTKIHFHTLRASFGSFLLQQGVPISTISKLLGHSSIRVTEQSYVSLTNNNLFEAIRFFEKI